MVILLGHYKNLQRVESWVKSLKRDDVDHEWRHGHRRDRATGYCSRMRREQ